MNFPESPDHRIAAPYQQGAGGHEVLTKQNRMVGGGFPLMGYCRQGQVKEPPDLLETLGDDAVVIAGQPAAQHRRLPLGLEDQPAASQAGAQG